MTMSFDSDAPGAAGAAPCLRGWFRPVCVYGVSIPVGVQMDLWRTLWRTPGPGRRRPGLLLSFHLCCLWTHARGRGEWAYAASRRLLARWRTDGLVRRVWDGRRWQLVARAL